MKHIDIITQAINEAEAGLAQVTNLRKMVAIDKSYSDESRKAHNDLYDRYERYLDDDLMFWRKEQTNETKTVKII